MKHRFLPLPLLLGLLIPLWMTLTAVGAPAATITVDTLSDVVAVNGACSLREAIINANMDSTAGSTDCTAGSGTDTIIIQPTGTITLLSGHLEIISSMTINGPGSSQLTIDGNNNDRIFYIDGDPDITVAIDGLTLVNGLMQSTNSNDRGGAISARDATLTLTDMVMANNEARLTDATAFGGGMAGFNLDLTMTAVTITGNLANGVPGMTAGLAAAKGGGLYLQAVTADLTDVRIEDNLSQSVFAVSQGGGMAVQSSLLTAHNLRLGHNTALVDNVSTSTTTASGGGLYATVSSQINLYDSHIFQNMVTGVYTDSGNIQIYTGTNGGGINANDESVLYLENTDVYSNTAVYGPSLLSNGGGLMLNTVEFTAVNSNIYGNVAADSSGGTAVPNGHGFGGGIRGDRSNFTLTDTIIRDNHALGGGGVYLSSAGLPCGTYNFQGGTVRQNVVSETGGGMYVSNNAYDCTSYMMDGTTIESNTAALGGGLYTFSGSVHTTDTIIRGNSATASGSIGNGGGGVYVEEMVTTGPTIVTIPVVLGHGTIVQSNNTVGAGGGIYTLPDSFLQLEGVTVLDNESSGAGGGIYKAGTFTMTETTVQANTATGGFSNGGGIYSISGRTFIQDSAVLGNNTPGVLGSAAGIYYEGSPTETLTIDRTTIAYNIANLSGGGLVQGGNGIASLTNTTLSNNTGVGTNSTMRILSGDIALTNVTVYGDGSSDSAIDAAAGVNVLLQNTLIADNFDTACTGSGTFVTGGAPNLDGDGSCGSSLVGPAVLDGLLNDGGYGPTRMPDSSSPAVDAGDNAICAALPGGNEDQRGVSRVSWDGNGNPADGDPCDIGAVERRTCVTLSGAMPVDGSRSGANVGLNWMIPSATVNVDVFRSETDAYFPPPSKPLDTVVLSGVYTDTAVLDTTMTAFYALEARNDCGTVFPFDNRVGAFTFAITPGD